MATVPNCTMVSGSKKAPYTSLILVRFEGRTVMPDGIHDASELRIVHEATR